MLNAIQKERIILASILTAFFVVSLINIDNEIPGHDEATYYYQGKLIVNPQLYYLCQADPQRCDIYPPKAVHTYTDHPPFAKYLFAFALMINDSVISGRIFILLFGVGVLFFVYMLTKKLYDERTALLATALSAVSLPVVNLSRVIYADMPLMFFVLAALYFFYTGFREKPLYMLPGGLFAGLAILTKFPGLFVLVPIGYMFLRYGLKFEGDIKKLSFDVKADGKIINMFLVSMIIVFLVGFLIYNLITLSLYGLLSFERTLQYQQAVGKTELKSIDIIGYLGVVNHIIPLMPLFVLGIAYLCARHRPEDIIILLALALYSVVPMMARDYFGFFAVASPSQYYLPVAIFAAITLSVFLFCLHRKIPNKLLFVALGIVAVAQIVYLSPLYFEYQGHKDDMPMLKLAIAELGNRVPKTEPLLTTYNGLGLKYIYGWERTYLIDTLKPVQIKEIIEQNKGTGDFSILLDWEHDDAVELIGSICPRSDIITGNKTIFYLWKC